MKGYQYTCSEDAFRVRSEDRDEVVELIQQHAEGKHDMEMSRQDVLDGIEEEEVDV